MCFLFPITEIYFEKIASTNSFLLDTKTPFKEWTVVYTKEQNAGRGYTGNQWESTIGMNLTFSILLNPNCAIQHIFYLNKIIANAVHQSIHSIVDSKIKWPNDLIINHKKVGGILIENILGKQVNSSVIGIGLNVNQTNFESLLKATSLKNETGIHFNLDELRYTIIEAIQKEYQVFIDKQFDSIELYFHKHLYMKDQVALFKIQNQVKKGIIKETDSNGKLIIDLVNEGLQSFQLKEVQLLY
ncbi:MAG: biotin--[acetyl-CoA-carboxylase] ligase [Flavobacteriales bacterium]